MQSSLRVNFLYPLIRARTKLGLPEELSGDGYGMFVKQRLPSVVGHQAETLMEFAFAAGVPRGGAEWSLRLDPAAVTAARQRSNGARTLAIAPGTADPACAWPLDRMAALARRAQDQLGLRVVLLGNSEAEREAARFVKGEVNGVLDASAAPLPEQFANLASARALVSADTDAVAFARCFSTPVVGLYASSRMDWCGPHLATKFCLDKYAEALQLVSKKEVDKFPRNHRIRDARAMALISLDEVLEQLNAALASRGG